MLPNFHLDATGLSSSVPLGHSVGAVDPLKISERRWNGRFTATAAPGIGEDNNTPPTPHLTIFVSWISNQKLDNSDNQTLRRIQPGIKQTSYRFPLQWCKCSYGWAWGYRAHPIVPQIWCCLKLPRPGDLIPKAIFFIIDNKTTFEIPISTSILVLSHCLSLYIWKVFPSFFPKSSEPTSHHQDGKCTPNAAYLTGGASHESGSSNSVSAQFPRFQQQ
mgnify:CR=1 FL=1